MGEGEAGGIGEDGSDGSLCNQYVLLTPAHCELGLCIVSTRNLVTDDFTEEVDCGEPIITEEVELRKDECLEDLESRMHMVEHRLIVEGTRLAIERLWKEKRTE